MEFIAQTRIGPHEMYIIVNANNRGEAIVELAKYLQTINDDPLSVFAVYHVEPIVNKEFIIDDIILN